MRRMASYKAAILLMAGLAVMGCNAVERFMRVGNDVAVGPLENPTHRRGYRPISMPMPKPKIVEMRSNSLWRQGSRAFFKDLRASEIGDVITVVINIADEAKLNNKSTQKRDDSSVSALNNVLGLESNLSKFLPGAVTGASLLNTSSDRNISGAGSIERKETINLKVAAVVTQILPNGNLVIHGRQETSINFEVRELQVAGVIRPEDVSSANTIKYEQIAEARVVYGGRGSISDLQRPRWGSEIVDVLLPF
ncbi:MAG: flagellar basal body L-ring protein FlgH [Alphaproteobacteria bacterium]|nr:flagellar basal body L-ring protein FlgH [Alphaproteobacteria bacterium]